MDDVYIRLPAAVAERLVTHLTARAAECITRKELAEADDCTTGALAIYRGSALMSEVLPHA